MKGKGQTPKKISSFQPSFKSKSNFKPKNTYQNNPTARSKHIRAIKHEELTKRSHARFHQLQWSFRGRGGEMLHMWKVGARSHKRMCLRYFCEMGEMWSCSYWTHLLFCSQVKLLRRGSEFRCLHCVKDGCSTGKHKPQRTRTDHKQLSTKQCLTKK